MKKIFVITLMLTLVTVLKAQEFNTQLSTAKSSYSSGKLDDSRFAMQQMLQEIDMMVGKEILKLLPQKLEDKASNSSQDRVTGTSGFMGVKNSLVNNINAKKKKGTSRPKKKSTISKKAYKDMKNQWE